MNRNFTKQKQFQWRKSGLKSLNPEAINKESISSLLDLSLIINPKTTLLWMEEK